MSADTPEATTDSRVLALFDSPAPVETNTPGARAWVARDASDGGRLVLIKRLGSATGSGGKGRATEALALLHPAVVRTRRWIQEDGALYVVRDVVRGRNLRQALAGQGGPNESAPSPEELRRYLLPVIEALEYAHGLGAAHGGVSPENVLVSEDGRVLVSDFATADPKSSQHFRTYSGTANAGGDVRAVGRVLARMLPHNGPFANGAVRGRIEGIVERCDTLADLREAMNTLERLAAAPVPRGTPTGGKGDAASSPTPAPGPPPLIPQAPPGTAPPVITEPPSNPAPWVVRPGAPFASDPPPVPGVPRLTCTLAEKSVRVAQGGGGAATLIVRNDGDATLVVRMIATQHPWLNVRPLELPLSLPAGGTVNISFAVSAARLTPGEYRSEVYLSANASGKGAEDLRGGWFKHTAEVRITVDPLSAGGAGASMAAPTDGKPPFPVDAPRLPATPGCGTLMAAVPVVVTAGSMWLWWLLHAG